MAPLGRTSCHSRHRLSCVAAVVAIVLSCGAGLWRVAVVMTATGFSVPHRPLAVRCPVEDPMLHLSDGTSAVGGGGSALSRRDTDGIACSESATQQRATDAASLQQWLQATFADRLRITMAPAAAGGWESPHGADSPRPLPAGALIGPHAGTHQSALPFADQLQQCPGVSWCTAEAASCPPWSVLWAPSPPAGGSGVPLAQLPPSSSALQPPLTVVSIRQALGSSFRWPRKVDHRIAFGNHSLKDDAAGVAASRGKSDLFHFDWPSQHQSSGGGSGGAGHQRRRHALATMFPSLTDDMMDAMAGRDLYGETVAEEPGAKEEAVPSAPEGGEGHRRPAVCAQFDAVFGYARNFKPPDVVAIAESFLRYSRRCDQLILWCEPATVRALRQALSPHRRPDKGRVLLLNENEWTRVVYASQRFEGLPRGMTGTERIAVFLLWMELFHMKYRYLVHIDVRDSIFYDNLFAQLEEVNVTGLFSVAEVHLFKGQAHNNMWVTSYTGSPAATDFFSKMTLHGRPLPVLCSGIYGGTSTAVYDYLAAFADAVLHAGSQVHSIIGIDQGIHVYLQLAGLPLAGFPHPIAMLDDASGPMHHWYRGEVRRDKLGRHLNCLGRRYAVVHQLDRYEGLWHQAARDAYRLRTGPWTLPPAASPPPLSPGRGIHSLEDTTDETSSTSTDAVVSAWYARRPQLGKHHTIRSRDGGGGLQRTSMTVQDDAFQLRCIVRHAAIVVCPTDIDGNPASFARVQVFLASFQRHHGECDEVHVFRPRRRRQGPAARLSNTSGRPFGRAQRVAADGGSAVFDIHDSPRVTFYFYDFESATDAGRRAGTAPTRGGAPTAPLDRQAADIGLTRRRRDRRLESTSGGRALLGWKGRAHARVTQGDGKEEGEGDDDGNPSPVAPAEPQTMQHGDRDWSQTGECAAHTAEATALSKALLSPLLALRWLSIMARKGLLASTPPSSRPMQRTSSSLSSSARLVVGATAAQYTAVAVFEAPLFEDDGTAVVPTSPHAAATIVASSIFAAAAAQEAIVAEGMEHAAARRGTHRGRPRRRGETTQEDHADERGAVVEEAMSGEHPHPPPRTPPPPAAANRRWLHVLQDPTFVIMAARTATAAAAASPGGTTKSLAAEGRDTTTPPASSPTVELATAGFRVNPHFYVGSGPTVDGFLRETLSMLWRLHCRRPRGGARCDAAASARATAAPEEGRSGESAVFEARSLWMSGLSVTSAEDIGLLSHLGDAPADGGAAGDVAVPRRKTSAGRPWATTATAKKPIIIVHGGWMSNVTIRAPSSKGGHATPPLRTTDPGFVSTWAMWPFGIGAPPRTTMTATIGDTVGVEIMAEPRERHDVEEKEVGNDEPKSRRKQRKAGGRPRAVDIPFADNGDSSIFSTAASSGISRTRRRPQRQSTASSSSLPASFVILGDHFATIRSNVALRVPYDRKGDARGTDRSRRLASCSLLFSSEVAAEVAAVDVAADHRGRHHHVLLSEREASFTEVELDVNGSLAAASVTGSRFYVSEQGTPILRYAQHHEQQQHAVAPYPLQRSSHAVGVFASIMSGAMRLSQRTDDAQERDATTVVCDDESRHGRILAATGLRWVQNVRVIRFHESSTSRRAAAVDGPPPREAERRGPSRTPPAAPPPPRSVATGRRDRLMALTLEFPVTGVVDVSKDGSRVPIAISDSTRPRRSRRIDASRPFSVTNASSHQRHSARPVALRTPFELSHLAGLGDRAPSQPLLFASLQPYAAEAWLDYLPLRSYRLPKRRDDADQQEESHRALLPSDDAAACYASLLRLRAIDQGVDRGTCVV